MVARRSLELVSQYVEYLQYALLVALIGGIGWFVYGRRRQRRKEREGLGQAPT